MTRMTDSWTDRLSEYVDGELDAETRAALEAHLATCADCRATRDELERVVARARRIGYREPRTDLWGSDRGRRSPQQRGRAPDVVGESSRCRGAPRGRRRDRRGRWRVDSRGRSPRSAPDRRGGTAAAATRLRPAARDSLAPGAPSLAVASYRDAAADLERTFEAGATTLRPETMRVIEENLRTIDLAIAQTDSALRRDPGSAYLNQYLAATMQRKLKLLRRAVEITTARS